MNDIGIEITRIFAVGGFLMWNKFDDNLDVRLVKNSTGCQIILSSNQASHSFMIVGHAIHS